MGSVTKISTQVLGTLYMKLAGGYYGTTGMSPWFYLSFVSQ